jgi:hypothetical protein
MNLPNEYIVEEDNVYQEYNDNNNDDDYINNSDIESNMEHMSNSFIALSSTAFIPLNESTYRPKWSYIRYFCWMIPIMWSSFFYLSQFIYGIIIIPNNITYNLGVYNIVGGFVGLVYVSLQVVDNWNYIIPYNKLKYKVETKSLIWSWFVFITGGIIDMFLFTWSIFGSVWALQLIGSEYMNNSLIWIFSLANILFQWSKYGLVVFSIRFIVSSKLLNKLLL